MRLLGWLVTSLRNSYSPQGPGAQDWPRSTSRPRGKEEHKVSALVSKSLLPTLLAFLRPCQYHSLGCAQISLRAATPKQQLPHWRDRICSLGAAVKGTALGLGGAETAVRGELSLHHHLPWCVSTSLPVFCCLYYNSWVLPAA